MNANPFKVYWRLSAWVTLVLLLLINGSPAAPTSAQPIPPGTMTLSRESADVNTSSSLLNEVGTFPQASYTYGPDWPIIYYTEEARAFYVNTTYPHPYVKFLGIQSTGAYIDSCVNQPPNKIHCTGTIPAGSPTTPVPPDYLDFRFVLEGTCSLYNDPQSQLTIAIDTDLCASQPYQESVEPILDLGVAADNPTDNEKDVLIEANHQGPLLQWHDETGGLICGDGSDPYTQDILYGVTIQREGKAPVRVGDQRGECSRQIQLSESDLSCMDDGDPAPWTWTVTAVDIKYSPCVDPLLKKDNDLHFTTASCRPELLEVTPKYGEASFLNAIQVENPYRVEVDWNGEAYQSPLLTPPYGDVHFEINGVEQPQGGIDGEEWGAEHTLDMGSAFNAGWTGGENALRIWATYLPDWATQDIESEYRDAMPIVYPFPEWATTLPVGPFTVDAQEGAVIYENTVSYPEEPFNANVQVPNWVPYLGGGTLGILETQAEGSFEACSAGEGKLALDGGTGLGVGGFDIVGEAGGEGNFNFTLGEGLELVKSTFNLAVSAPLQKEMTLADLIPGIRAAEEWWLVGGLIKKVTRATKVTGELIPKVGIQADFSQQGHDKWVFEGSIGRGEMSVSVQAEFRPYEALWVSVYGGGTPFVELNFPANPDYLRRVGIDLAFKAALHAWRWEVGYDRAVTCSLPEGGCSETDSEAQQLALDGATWTLMERDYVDKGYHTFVGDAATLQSHGLMAGSTTTETALVADVYPLTEPALAVRDDGHRTLLYIHDDPTKPLGQGEELFALQWDGVNWSNPPQRLTDDVNLDFSPQTVYDSAGNAIAVWERSYTDVITSGLNITFAQQLDIAALTWVSATQSWEAAPTMLTEDNGRLDHAPRLRAGDDGAVLALWRSSDGTDLLGTVGHPLDLTYATWNGTAWSAPQAALTSLTGVLDFDVAVYTATQAALVYAQDTDGDPVTSADTELFYSAYDGADWSAPLRLTNDAVTDTTPALTYDASGALTLVWLRGEDIVTLVNSLDVTEAQSVRPDSTAAGLLDLALSRSPQGHLALIWQASHDNFVDLTYAVYDSTTGHWGADQHLTQDDAVEAAFVPAFDADGALHLAYRKTATTYVTETMTISPTLTVTVTDIPRPGESSLAVLSHTIGRDLTVEALTLTPRHPAAGDAVTLTAQVRNSGDLEAGPVAIRFDDDGTPIDTLTVPSTTAGTVVTATLAWTAPAAINSAHSLDAIVDPDDTIAETFEDNNIATITAFAPRLVADWAVRESSTETLTYTLHLHNAGPSPAQAPIPVTLRATTPDGVVLATGQTDDDVAPGAQVAVTVIVTEPMQLRGQSEDGWLVAGDPVPDRGNAWPVALGVWPDLTLTAADLQVSESIQVTVRNVGVLTATNVTLNARHGGLTGTLVYSGTLGTLTPGDNATASFPAPDVPLDLWARVDPDNRIRESDETNNLATHRAQVEYTIYLPLVMRQ